ncbi:hypothetical protein IVA80_26640 [Bradyrhizobium sp. 139]|uniref:hypothetical protein n=1 Tax=Bradyrhizobium sp. 139 TaxID=2782616 RepID=UPI001FF93459|nr:hypothetical protein [Bradyrhizobium sp. 139]MCK1744302.1 hypothetical protein [Bradyrhizobium sp. 139]
MTGPSAAQEKRAPSLTERFAKVGRSSGKQPGEAITPEQPKASKRETSFREQAEEVTGKKDRGQPSLADKFRKAQERSAGAKKDSRDQFKDNADDVSKDMGRERNKKPPK